MALAAQADVEARLGRALEVAEAAQVPTLLDDASAVVVGHCRQDFEPAPYPTAVVGVVAKMAARSLTAASAGTPFATQQSAGPFTVSLNAGASSGDVWMSAADKLALRPYRSGGGLTSVQHVSDRYTIEP